MTDLVERLARVLDPHAFSPHEYRGDAIRQTPVTDVDRANQAQARCDIRAILADLDAAGYAIVPKKPTPAMIEAGNQHVDWRMSADIYTAMVEAAAKTEPST